MAGRDDSGHDGGQRRTIGRRRQPGARRRHPGCRPGRVGGRAAGLRGVGVAAQRPPGRGTGAAGHRPAVQDGEAAAARGAAGRRRWPTTGRSPRPPPPAPRAGSTTRPGHPARLADRRRHRRHSASPACLLHLQDRATARSTRSTTSSARDCAALNRERRDARTDLTGRRALLTGGRAKIGMYIALRLLRDGAHTTITTRFPHDAVRRFTAMPDSADWLHRLRVVGIDLRDPAQVVALADSVAAQGPLDILINNAAQTVRRTPGAYAPLVAAETAAAARAGRCRSCSPSTAWPAVHRWRCRTGTAAGRRRSPPHALTALALTGRSATPERIAAGHRHRRRRARPRPRRRPTAGCSGCTRSTRSSCSRCSCAT